MKKLMKLTTEKSRFADVGVKIRMLPSKLNYLKKWAKSHNDRIKLVKLQKFL